MADMREWLGECERALGEADRCAERLSRAGRADGIGPLRARIARLTLLLEKARRERAIVQLIGETDPERTNPEK